jgi:serine/threonine protein kinase
MIDIKNLKWPANVFPAEQATIRECLFRCWMEVSRSSPRGKRALLINKKEEALPLSLTIIYGIDGLAKDILLMLNRARGLVLDCQARHPPKTCFSLMTGESYVKVRLTTTPECGVYARLLDHPMPGLPEVVCLRFKDSKAQAIMKKYDSDLYAHISNHLTVEERLALAVKVCQALRNFQWADFGPECEPVFHGDVKTENYLVKDGVPVLADFGWSCRYECPGGTVAFMAPEIMNLWKRAHMRYEGQEIDFTDMLKCYGPQSDIWSLGLVLAEIFDASFTPREFLNEQQIYNQRRKKWYKTCLFAEQGVIEQVFERRKEACRDADVARIWDLIKDHMVRLDPKERWTADHILSEINRIVTGRGNRLFDEYLDAL